MVQPRFPECYTADLATDRYGFTSYSGLVLCEQVWWWRNTDFHPSLAATLSCFFFPHSCLDGFTLQAECKDLNNIIMTCLHHVQSPPTGLCSLIKSSWIYTNMWKTSWEAKCLKLNYYSMDCHAHHTASSIGLSVWTSFSVCAGGRRTWIAKL